jgi:CBS domain-containing protein
MAQQVRELMAEPVTVPADTTLTEAAVRRLPVVDGERLVGIISLGDLAIERDQDSTLAEISAADPNS